MRSSALRRETVYRLLEEMELVEPTTPVLRPRLTADAGAIRGPWDAIPSSHGAAARRETREGDLVLATHDRALAAASRASGLRVVGV